MFVVLSYLSSLWSTASQHRWSGDSSPSGRLCSHLRLVSEIVYCRSSTGLYKSCHFIERPPYPLVICFVAFVRSTSTPSATIPTLQDSRMGLIVTMKRAMI
ncbi:hypothetical protein F4803DRAFT_64338 [Xylaria telfairii]|nr:hypothetical protein F4803DRAFT_64338 [Xylaria telfairii]